MTIAIIGTGNMGSAFARALAGRGAEVLLGARDASKAAALAAEELQTLAPKAHVVKAFNTIFAGLIAPAERANKPVQTFVAGDDTGAVSRVTEIAKKMGLKPVKAGSLRNARFIEPTGMLNIQLGAFQVLGTAVAPEWT